MINYELVRYDFYKDSGFDWLGEIPEPWKIKRLKDLSKLIVDGTHFTPDYTDHGVHFLSVNDITRKSFDLHKSKFISYDAHRELVKRCHPKKGDILLSKNGTIGIPFVIDFDDEISIYVSLCLIKLLASTNSRYSYYSFLASFMFEQYNLHSKMTSVTNLHLDKLRDFYQLIPSLFEQKAIADYLDTKTAQIDRKIDLFTQKANQYGKLKQSLINETVTRGLDKTVAMKDSGVEWIGEVPEHWGVSAITNITTTVSIKNHPEEELLSVYRDYGVIIKSTRDDNHNKAGQDLSNYKLVEPGFLVINKMKAWQGSLGVSEFRGIVSPAYITCQTDKKIIERSYLHHLLRCQNYINEYNRLSYGVRVDQWDMRYDDFKYVPVLLPPIEEQKTIADYLDTKTAHIDRIVESINTHIDKLRELRKTLINDVVTGKIKVA